MMASTRSSVLALLALCFLLGYALAQPTKEESVSEEDEDDFRGPLPVDHEYLDDRVSFLQWLLSIIGTGWTSTEEPEPQPIDPGLCSPCKCGIANKRVRIIGGTQTEVNQYPWMAELLYNNRFYCGGSLLNSKYVLTASHCVNGFVRSRIIVRLLDHRRDISSESQIIERKVKRIIMHSRYDQMNFNNDIALLRLDEDVELDGVLRPVCLPELGRSFTGMQGLVTGWGVTVPNGAPSQVLNEVTVPIMSNKDCKNTAYGSKKITDNMLCAGYPEGKKDSCQGDSGGPLHIVNDTLHHVVGVVSWGEGCARPNHPGVYTRVNRYITWIKRNTKDSCFCQ